MSGFTDHRLRQQILANEVAVHAARNVGVCQRPMVAYVDDTHTGERQRVTMECGATKESKCPACADKARRLRMHQCREGWHLTDEPLLRVELDELAAVNGWADLPDVWGPYDGRPDNNDDDGQDEEEEPARRVRSTRRRQDAPDLPKVPMSSSTLGKVFKGRDGKVHRPSMFITLTLGSYGPVTQWGTPRNPETYDYRAAALDALHFPKLMDRFWQNLRRCCGFNVQYFAAVEPQRRLAPHAHAAVRGAVPHAVFRQVVAATYHQLWWPSHRPEDLQATPGDVDTYPTWNPDLGAYIDVHGCRLPSWDEALDALDADPQAEPAHVVRFGGQVDSRGLIPGKHDTDKAVAYLCKYLTKDAGTTFDPDGDLQDDDDETGQLARERTARRAHQDRLHAELRWLPCCEQCPNWLLYGIAPKDAGPQLRPGHCRRQVHRRENLGLGRRCLVSRKWTGKTLTDHRADRTAVIRQTLEEAGLDMDDHEELSVTSSDGRYQWTIIPPSRLDPAEHADAVGELITVRQRWQADYRTARTALGRDGPPGHRQDDRRPVAA